eukprot:scaffold65_cov353-Prasinococcus_capsulatus_cf.AAC.17
MEMRSRNSRPGVVRMVSKSSSTARLVNAPIVYVLPLLVCPYAKTVAAGPARPPPCKQHANEGSLSASAGSDFEAEPSIEAGKEAGPYR